MKYYLRLSAVLAVCLVFIASCSRKNEVNVTGRNFETEVDQQQNLQFEFNKDLYPDSLLQQWDSAGYIDFQPSVKGMYRWNSSSQLQFSPASGFLPGTEYTATVTRQIMGRSRKQYALGEKTKFKFHTAPLQIAAAHLSYARGRNSGSVMTQMDLDFNYEVKVTDAAARLKLSSNGQPVSFNAINGGNGKTVSVQFLPVTGEDKEVPLKIELAKGIPIAAGGYKSAADTSITAQIPSRYSLTITGIASQHSGTAATVTLSTSQPVKEEGLKNFISIEPAVAFDVQAADGSVTITSTEMKPDQTYQLTVAHGLEGQFHGKLKNDYSEQITFGKIAPSINFVNAKGMYLSSRGYKNLALNIVNVPKVEVTVIKVYENNLNHFLRRGTTSDYGYEEEEGSGSFDVYQTANMGDTIFHQDYETSRLPGLNAARVLHLDFQDKIKNYNGVYVITVSSKEHYWVQQSKVLSISDIAMIVKEEKDNVYVFANSIRDARPLTGVKVSFISTNNQQLYTATTDGEGMAVFNEISRQSPGFHVGLVTAKMNDEFSFVWLDGSKIETSRYDVGGRVPNATGLNAMIYAERNLYRPGEVLHVSTVVRDENWNNPGELPVKLRLMMPNGKEFATMRKILNAEGSCETAFPVPASALTGTYTLEVYSGNDILLNSYNISIEEFMPDRLKAAIKIDKPEYRLGDSVRMTLQADNLFGTPAMNRNWEAELNLEKQAFTADKYDDYQFGISKDFSFNTQLSNGTTDEKGSATATFGLSPDYTEAGLIKGSLMATVFDETGRPVHRYEHFKVYTQPYFIGIKGGSYDYVSTRSMTRIPLIALDKNGVVQNNVQAEITVIKKEWNTVIEQSGDHYRYVSQEQKKVVARQSLRISGENSYYSYTPVLSGAYEVHVSLPGREGYVSKSFYAWGYSDSQYTSFEVNNEGNVDIKPDKAKYNQGDEVKLLFTTPFEGRMLVTVERDKMLKHYYLETNNKSASLSFKADDIFVPNVYVTATLFRPMDGTDMPLTVAHGFRNIPVENVKNHLPVEVTVAAKSRSKTKQQITVKTAPGAYVTIAAVDEGILQVKNYETPDPYTYFYQKVALSVNSYDIYPLLLPEIKTTRSSTGGDAAGDKNDLRVNPNFVNRVKLVSFWSGIVQADGSGMVRYNIDVPQFSGDIRVMAYAYKGKGFGGADQHMKVADPVVISAALPRVLSPKDEVIMPVTLSNTTAKDAAATVTVQVTGPLSVAGTARQQVMIPANREARAVFNVTALSAIGAGKVTVSVQALSETFVNETEIGVRPPASLQKITGSGTVAGGTSVTVNPSANFLPGTASGKFIIGKSPLVPFSKNMEYLVRYPYGCVEQTTSAAFPQLYYTDLVKSITGVNAEDPNPNYNVQQAILKLQSMQLSNGSLMYWPGGSSESWWGSVYATHFLLEAKKAGYEVNEKTVDHLLQYLRFKLQKRETEVLYYNQNLKKEIAAKEVAYSLYVLALAGQPQLATMNYYKGNPGMMAIDSKYLLAAAYGLSGQPQQARQILPGAFAGEKADKAFGGSFYSYIRDAGISLSALVDVDPSSPQIGTLARQVSSFMASQPYLNTQENVWGILALGKIARAANTTSATAGVYSGSQLLVSSQGAAVSVSLKDHVNKPLQVQVKGKGNYYYFWETAGITADGSYKEEDSYLKVRRTYYNRSGQPIAGNTFRQNELIVIKLTLVAQYSTEVANVVVTDMLPAGFEIENTRLTDMEQMKWIKEAATPDYLDYRDDRLNLFTTANGTTKDFYYMVRAVSPGTYQLGPVQADAMYNGFFHSYHGAGVIKVE